MRRIPERVVQQHVVRFLRMVGARVYVLGTVRRRGDFPGTMQSPGLPDLYAFVPVPSELGRVWFTLWVECKGAGGRLRPEQAEFRDQCLEAKQAHVVGGLDDVIALMVRWGVVRTHQVPAYRLTQNGKAE
jgi:hypothetical protein